MMEGRSWSGGLHQAIEAKEGLEMTDATQAHTQMSFQMFFRRYKNLSGMSGTLQNLKKELWSIYRLLVVPIPTHVPKQLSCYREQLFPSHDEKWSAVISSVLKEVANGRAVLVGTRSIVDSESLSDRLRSYGLEPAVLHAKKHAEEAEIVAEAGQVCPVVTIATNMAGRGTDIAVQARCGQGRGITL